MLMLPKAAMAKSSYLSRLSSSVGPDEHFLAYGDEFRRRLASRGNFEEHYTVGEMIGEGGFGKVFIAQHSISGQKRAVKRIKSLGKLDDATKNEIDALLSLDHPHIVKLVEFFEGEKYLHLVFELCEGPDLFDRITETPEGKLSEDEASVALRHILKALQCCHAEYRGHYDIKPENFMYTKQDMTNLKMIDLGLSSGFEKARVIKGTDGYMAPEFWDGLYGPEGDIWSCGIVLFVMLTGEAFLPDVPPETKKREVKVRELLRKQLDDAAKTHNFSAEVQDLLRAMLQHDRHARPTVREALNHPFNTSSYRRENMMVPTGFDQMLGEQAFEVRQRLAQIFRNIAAEPVLKRIACMVMAHVGDVCPAERMAFRMLDRHGYGNLSVTVLTTDFEVRGEEVPKDFDMLFGAVDINNDGYISFLEFLGATLPAELRRKPNLCEVAFAVLDQGNDGFVDASDLALLFGLGRDSLTCQEIFQEVCSERALSLDGFKQLMGS